MTIYLTENINMNDLILAYKNKDLFAVKLYRQEQLLIQNMVSKILKK